MKAGGWPSIALIYLHGVAASASLSKIIPLLSDVETHLGASSLQFGLLIALMTVAPALLAAVTGSLIDRVGARSALTVAALIGVAVNLAYLMAGSLHDFMVIRVVEGLVVTGIYSAAPALIMATASPQRRGRAMALWSTYTPVGMSTGLLLSACFAGSEAWRTGYLLHLALFGALLAAGPWLPRSPVVAHEIPSRPGLLSALTQEGPVRLSLTFSALLLMGFGMSTVFPEWFALQHRMTVGAASSILAFANLAMIPGGLIAGWLLGRGQRDIAVFATLMLLAAILSLPLFMPGHDQLLRMVVTALWMMVQGAAIAVVTSALPRVVHHPAQGAAAAGLLSQCAAITTFVTPLVWRPILAGGRWHWFLVVVVLSAAGALALFPRRSEAAV